MRSRLDHLRAVEASAIIVALGLLTRAAFGVGSFYGVGDLPGGAFGSLITDISGDGRFVVGHSRADASHSNNIGAVFRWSATGGMEDLGFGAIGSLSSAFRGPNISRDGSLIAGTADVFGGFRFTIGGDYRILGNSVHIGDMSADGQIIGGASLDSGSFPNRAVQYRATNNYTVEYINPFPTASYQGVRGISDDGRAISLNTEENGASSTYLVRENQPPILVHTVPFSQGSLNGIGFDISGDGSKIIGRTWQWSVQSGFESLANRINPMTIAPDSRTVLGSFGGRAKLLREDGTIVDVQNLLSNDYGIDFGTWRLREIVGMSDDGTVWAGNGINPQGFQEGWVAVIPEPTSAALSVLGLIALIRRRR